MKEAVLVQRDLCIKDVSYEAVTCEDADLFFEKYLHIHSLTSAVSHSHAFALSI